jgi:2-oxoglutarate/2-oxoacid ferredoxin oxidoreductase subunit alpha
LFMIEGDPDATIGLISWGSVAGIALEALRRARAEGIEIKLLIPKLLYPVAEDIYREFFATLQQCYVIEQSHQGQLHRLIRMWVDVPAAFNVLAKSGANPISPEDILAQIRAMVRATTKDRRSGSGNGGLTHVAPPASGASRNRAMD